MDFFAPNQEFMAGNHHNDGINRQLTFTIARFLVFLDKRIDKAETDDFSSNNP